MILPDSEIGRRNLEYYYLLASKEDVKECSQSYKRYHKILKEIAKEYGHDFKLTVAAFCALSPNNDYFGNLRSLVSVLGGLNNNIPCEQITISTYNHCKERAIRYLTRQEEFVSKNRGLKILSFYNNIVSPNYTLAVTVDGHIAAAFIGDGNLTMKDVILTKSNYEQISGVLFDMARDKKIIPNQLQAIIWHTRKRVHNIKFVQNQDMFHLDPLMILYNLDEIKPYGRWSQTPLERLKMAALDKEEFQMQMQQTFLPNESDKEEAPRPVQDRKVEAVSYPRVQGKTLCGLVPNVEK